MTNPPAFPDPDEGGRSGMSLRDYFAAQAPALTIETAAKLLGWPADLPMGDDDDDEYADTKVTRWRAMPAAEQVEIEAQWAFMYADAMLKERSKK